MNLSNFKLAIGIPLTDDQIHTRFFESFIQMKKPDYVYLRPQFPSQNIADVRNYIVQQAQMIGATHLLMMDTDQSYPDDLIEKLYNHKKPVVGAKVHRRYDPFDPILYKYDEKNKKYYMMDDEEWLNNDLVEVDATGGGCLFFDMKIFENIEYPWFKVIPSEESENGKTIGEDIYFCKKAKEAGYKIYVDTSIKIGHLALTEIDENFYRLIKLLRKENNTEV